MSRSIFTELLENLQQLFQNSQQHIDRLEQDIEILLWALTALADYVLDYPDWRGAENTGNLHSPNSSYAQLRSPRYDRTQFSTAKDLQRNVVNPLQVHEKFVKGRTVYWFNTTSELLKVFLENMNTNPNNMHLLLHYRLLILWVKLVEPFSEQLDVLLVSTNLAEVVTALLQYAVQMLSVQSLRENSMTLVLAITSSKLFNLLRVASSEIIHCFLQFIGNINREMLNNELFLSFTEKMHVVLGRLLWLVDDQQTRNDLTLTVLSKLCGDIDQSVATFANNLTSQHSNSFNQLELYQIYISFVCLKGFTRGLTETLDDESDTGENSSPEWEQASLLSNDKHETFSREGSVSSGSVFRINPLLHHADNFRDWIINTIGTIANFAMRTANGSDTYNTNTTHRYSVALSELQPSLTIACAIAVNVMDACPATSEHLSMLITNYNKFLKLSIAPPCVTEVGTCLVRWSTDFVSLLYSHELISTVIVTMIKSLSFLIVAEQFPNRSDVIEVVIMKTITEALRFCKQAFSGYSKDEIFCSSDILKLLHHRSDRGSNAGTVSNSTHNIGNTTNDCGIISQSLGKQWESITLIDIYMHLIIKSLSYYNYYDADVTLMRIITSSWVGFSNCSQKMKYSVINNMLLPSLNNNSNGSTYYNNKCTIELLLSKALVFLINAALDCGMSRAQSLSRMFENILNYVIGGVTDVIRLSKSEFSSEDNEVIARNGSTKSFTDSEKQSIVTLLSILLQKVFTNSLQEIQTILQNNYNNKDYTVLAGKVNKFLEIISNNFNKVLEKLPNTRSGSIRNSIIQALKFLE